MTIGFRVTGFAGIVPRTAARLLNDNQAQVAVNCRLTSGYIAPLKQPKLVIVPGVAGIQSIFRMTDGITDWWLAWSRDVDAVKGPIAGDTTFRTYFTGDGEPRVTNIALATAGTPYPAGWYVLGVYPPATAPTVGSSGGVSGTTVSRAWAYTFVTPWGEESQPSPAAAAVTAKIDDTWNISGMDIAPLNTMAVTGATWLLGVATLTVASTFGLRVGEEINVTGMNPIGYNAAKAAITAVTATTVSYALTTNPGAFVAGGTLARVAPHNTTGMTKRLYWTETLADGTHYRLVKEISVATTSTTVANAGTVSTAELASTDWIMPPTDMKGIRFMAGGIAVGFHGNELCISPAYIPYAFPNKYRQTTDYDIVGLEVVGNMVVLCTKGTPYVAAGVDPAGIVPTKIEQPWPCASKRSVINIGGGVQYAAPQGKVSIGPGGALVTTHDLFTLEEWSTFTPSSFNAAEFGGRYVASYSVGAAGRQALIIDKTEFAAVVQGNSNVTLFYGDKTTGKLYCVISDGIYEWDANTGLLMTMDWLSKEFVFPKPINLGAAKIDASFSMTAEQIAAAAAALALVQAANAKLVRASYLSIPGTVNSCASTPDNVNLRFTAGADFRTDFSMAYTAAGVKAVYGKRSLGAGENAFRLHIGAGSGSLVYSYSLDGAVVVSVSGAAPFIPALGYSDNSRFFVRVTHQFDNGAGGNQVRFWYSTNYNKDTGLGTWTEFGTPAPGVGVIVGGYFPATTVPLQVGASGQGGNSAAGKNWYSEWRNGINGPVVARFDPEGHAGAASWVEPTTGETWTINPTSQVVSDQLTKGSMNGHSLNRVSLNGSLLALLPPVTWESLTYSLYINGAIKFSRTVTDSKAFRLPAGYRSDTAAFRVSGNVAVKAVSHAETMRKLEEV